tara:strand:- start:438 stop:1178 length:741 start_codon:yes stop_codon:yes gene_type:complete
MARISTYALDSDLVGGDKWIGTSANNLVENATKNFSLNAVARFLNKTGIIESQALRYVYQNKLVDEDRNNGTISFPTSIGKNVNFSAISSWMLSTFAKPLTGFTGKDVHEFYTAPLTGSTVLVTNAGNPTNWAIYLWNSSTQNVLEPTFYDIGLTYISGSGNLTDGQDYLISLLRYDISGDSDKTFVFTQAVPSVVWNIVHTLDKFPSVSVVNNNNILINGEVTYIDKNNVQLNFSAGFAGKAYLN